MNTRITVPLERAERVALTQLAKQERREPRAQAAVLIRQALERLGLLTTQPLTNEETQTNDNR